MMNFKNNQSYKTKGKKNSEPTLINFTNPLLKQPHKKKVKKITKLKSK